MLENLSEKTLKKLKEISRLIAGGVKLPLFSESMEAKKVLETVLTGEGAVNQRYAQDVLIALSYANEKKDYFTGNLMLDDIIAGKNIIFTRYQ